jgi:hypothetical protein
MLKTYKNETPVTQIVYDIKMEPIQVAPGQTVQYDAGPLDWPVHSHESDPQGGMLNSEAIIGGVEFRDNFSEDVPSFGDMFWAWRKDNEKEDTKIIKQENGVLKIQIAEAVPDARWANAPKVLIGLPNIPCEIIAKIGALSLGDDCQAGIFLANRESTGFCDHFGLVRRKTLANEHEAFNGVGVIHGQHLTSSELFLHLAQDGIENLPIFLRIRIGGFSPGFEHAIFSYSLDGVTWLGNWIDYCAIDHFSSWPLAVGLFMENYIEGIVKNNGYVWFDFFEMKSATKG